MFFLAFFLKSKNNKEEAKGVEKIALYLLWFGALIQIAYLLARFALNKYFPVMTLFEVIAFITLIFAFGIIYLGRKEVIKNIELKLLPFLLILMSLTFFMDYTPGVVSFSNLWLIFHVPFGLGSYGGFIVSTIIAAIYFVKYLRNKRESKESLETYYNLIFKIIKISFILLTLCIVTGAIWAYFAWGSFWGWDSKETWSLLTWISYLISIILYNFNSKRKFLNILLVLLSFFVVVITFIGVNYFMFGLHSYI